MGSTIFCIDGPLEGQLQEVEFGVHEFHWLETKPIKFDSIKDPVVDLPYVVHAYKHRGHFAMPTGEHVPIWSKNPIPETAWKDPAWNEKIVKAYYTIAYPKKYALVKSTTFADALDAEMNNLISFLKKEQSSWAKPLKQLKQMVSYDELKIFYGEEDAKKIMASPYRIDSDARDWMHAGIRDADIKNLCFGCAEELIGPGMGQYNSMIVPKGKGRRVRQLVCSHCGRGRFNRFGKRIGDWTPSKISS